MSVAHESQTAEKEKQVKNLQRKLEPWRELIITVNSILTWEQSWYPGLILGLNTSLFLIYWMLEPAFLTWLSATLCSVALIDYLAPVLTSTFLSNNWTGLKEKKFEEICFKISLTIHQFRKAWNYAVDLRTKNPLIYYGVTYSCLFLLAWIGHVINNLLLLYLFINTILLLPGLKHKNRAQEAIKSLYNQVFHRKLA